MGWLAALSGTLTGLAVNWRLAGECCPGSKHSGKAICRSIEFAVGTPGPRVVSGV